MWKWCALALLVAAAAEPEPFWKSKSKVYERILNREVIISVRNDKGTSPKNTMYINGGGQVSAPRDFVFAAAQRFDEYPKVSSMVLESKYNSEKQTLNMKIGALGYTTPLTAKMRFSRDSEPYKMHYELVDGPLKGLQGEISFAAVRPQLSEIGLAGIYKYDEFPIPRIFLEFGLEVIFQRLGVSLRAFAEREWRQHEQGQQK